MLLVTDQGTVPKGAQKTPGALLNRVSNTSPSPQTPRRRSTSRGVRDQRGIQTAGEAGKGEELEVSRGAESAVVSGRKYRGLRGHTLLMGRASWGLQINCSILDTEMGSQCSVR